MSAQALAVEWLPCPYCGAKADDPCRTVTGYTRAPGQRTPWPHRERTYAVQQAHHEGYVLGIHAGYRNAAYALQNAREGAHWALRDGVPRLSTDVVEQWLLDQAKMWENRQ